MGVQNFVGGSPDYEDSDNNIDQNIVTGGQRQDNENDRNNILIIQNNLQKIKQNASNFDRSENKNTYDQSEE